VHAKQSQSTCFPHQAEIKITALVPVGDVRLHTLFDEFAHRCLDIAFLLR
jgi:hypothetical protein